MKEQLVDEIADVVVEAIDVEHGHVVDTPAPNPTPERRLLRWERGVHPDVDLRVAPSFVDSLAAMDENRYFQRLLDIKAWARQRSADRAANPWIVDDESVDRARTSRS